MNENLSCLAELREWLIALGTIAVAILAVWGDKFKDIFAGPQLVLEPKNFEGELTTFVGGKEVIFYHLAVKNNRSWSPAKNVRVLVVGILKKKVDGSYYRENIFVPQQLTWAPAEFHPPFPTISKEDTVDLGCLIKDDKFTLRTYVVPNNFKGYVEKNSAMRVEIEIVADNFVSKKAVVYEIAWDGIWSADLGEMKRHFVVKEILE